MTQLEEVTAKGTRDYFACKGVYRNPYPIGTNEFNAYERGWMQSLKRDDARMVDTSPLIESASKNREGSVNLYALAKGKK